MPEYNPRNITSLNTPDMSFIFSGFRPKYNIRHTRPTEPLSPPEDDAAHYWAQSEWWYYTGRLVDRGGAVFGFELTFFKRITSEDSAPLLLIPAHWLRDVGMVSHFAVTDLNRKRFAYMTVHNLYRAWRADPDRYHVAIGDWSARKEGAAHLLSAGMGDYRIDLEAVPTKGPVLHGKSGIVHKGGDTVNYYYSYTHMDVRGTIAVDGNPDPVRGTAWMDHEYGTISIGKLEKGWDWFSIRLDDDSELMVIHVRDTRDVPIKLFGTYVSREGIALHLSDADLEIRAGALWYSERTHAHYPAAWTIRVKPLDLVLDIRPLVADQELVTRPVPYWEGIVAVAGSLGARYVTGHGYVELVGYCKKPSFRKYSRWISGNSVSRASHGTGDD
jgi:predicted secreted hydrolase